MTIVRQIQPDEWLLACQVRLAALTDAPEAFSEALAEAHAMPDHEWKGRASRGAAGDVSFCALAINGGEPVGMAARLASSPMRVPLLTTPSPRARTCSSRWRCDEPSCPRTSSPWAPQGRIQTPGQPKAAQPLEGWRIPTDLQPSATASLQVHPDCPRDRLVLPCRPCADRVDPGELVQVGEDAIE